MTRSSKDRKDGTAAAKSADDGFRSASNDDDREGDEELD